MRFLILLVAISLANASPVLPPGFGDFIGQAVSGKRADDKTKLNFSQNTTSSSSRNSDPRNMNSESNGISEIEEQLKNIENSSPLTRNSNNSTTDAASSNSIEGERQRFLLSERAMQRYVLQMMSPVVTAAMSMNMIVPSGFDALSATHQQASTEEVAQQVQENRENPEMSPEEIALRNCAENIITAKETEQRGNPAASVPTYREAWAWCEELARGGVINAGDPAGSLLVSRHLSHFPAHPIFIKEKFPQYNLTQYFNNSGTNRLNEPNKLYLWEILTLRKRVEIERLSWGPNGNMNGPPGPQLIGAHKELDELKSWMDKYAGDLLYTYQENEFRQADQVKDPQTFIDQRARYLALMKAAYSDLMVATSIICAYQNRIDGASPDYVPFGIEQTNATIGPNANILSPNDMWARLEASGFAAPLRNRLQNLVAGPLYGVTVALPSAMNQLFVNHENPLVEGAVGVGDGQFTPTSVKVDCAKLSDNQEERIQYYLDRIEQGDASGELQVFSPRVRYGLLFAHNIALAQMAHEAVHVFRKVESIYGYPREDEKLVQNGEWIAVRDLRELLSRAAGFNGDQFKGRPFDTYYTERVRALQQLTIALANELDRVRGTGGSTLAGIGDTAIGGGVPFR